MYASPTSINSLRRRRPTQGLKALKFLGATTDLEISEISQSIRAWNFANNTISILGWFVSPIIVFLQMDLVY